MSQGTKKDKGRSTAIAVVAVIVGDERAADRALEVLDDFAPFAVRMGDNAWLQLHTLIAEAIKEARTDN